jgi:DNA-binding transcriptional ArsR family regulator
MWLTEPASWATFNHMVNPSAQRLDSVFHALSDSTRRAILRDVSKQEKTVGEIAKPYLMSLAAVSKHLKVLEAAELIARERRGSFQIVRLNAASLRPADDWLAYYEKFWSTQLDRLQSHLEGTHKGEGDGDDD